MATVEWIGAARRDDDNSQADPSRLINCYRERTGDKFVIKSVLGMTQFASLPGFFMRDMKEIAGKVYAAHSGKVWMIDHDGITYETANVIDSAETTISGNNGDLAISAGGAYYVVSGGVTTTPATGAISNVGSVSFLGQRSVLTERGGAKIQWSNVADASDFDALDFATAESRDDNLIRGSAINGQFWAFGERSIERWYLTGSADTAEFLAPVSGATVDIGLKAFGLLAEFPNGAFFIGSDNIVYLVSGGQLRPISSRGVETSVESGQPQRCFYYTDEGHKFCVIQFNDRPAWCYDISSDEWHERAEGVRMYNWLATAAVQAYGGNFVGTDSGGVYRLERTNADADGPLIRRGVSRTLEMEGRQFTIDKLQVSPRTGRSLLLQSVVAVLAVDETSALDAGDVSYLVVGYDDGDERDAKMMLRFSRDRGETWGPEKWRSLGKSGEYGKLVRIHALGRFYRANVEFTISEPAEIPMDAMAFLEVS